MKISECAVCLALCISISLLSGCEKPHRISLWELKCQACHDGKTELNGKVVIDQEQIKTRYKSGEELVKAVKCEGAPPCMNILKHDEKLVRAVGREILNK